jgi:HD superfamily phosphodiesterase
VTSLGALLHDIADWKFHGGDDAARAKLSACSSAKARRAASSSRWSRSWRPSRSRAPA